MNDKYPIELVYQLKSIYKEFCEVCERGLQLNEKLVREEQYEYHESLKAQYQAMLCELTSLCADEYMMDDKVDFESTIFDYISGSNNA